MTLMSSQFEDEMATMTASAERKRILAIARSLPRYRSARREGPTVEFADDCISLSELEENLGAR